MMIRPPVAVPFSPYTLSADRCDALYESKIDHLPGKRLFDIIFSGCALLVAAPLMLLVAIAIKCTSPGPIFYSQLRVGRGGRRFYCHKFRTMYADADKKLEALLRSDPEIRKEWREQHKLKSDPRITSLGRFLRKSSIDELPQFWNVLRGELSVVGPRPVVDAEVERFLRHRAPVILSVRPGLTCTWQVSGRSNTNRIRRMAMDMHYTRHRSLLMDISLIARTVPSLLSARGAY